MACPFSSMAAEDSATLLGLEQRARNATSGPTSFTSKVASSTARNDATFAPPSSLEA
jgi:hypothetical protein